MVKKKDESKKVSEPMRLTDKKDEEEQSSLEAEEKPEESK